MVCLRHCHRRSIPQHMPRTETPGTLRRQHMTPQRMPHTACAHHSRHLDSQQHKPASICPYHCTVWRDHDRHRTAQYWRKTCRQTSQGPHIHRQSNPRTRWCYPYPGRRDQPHTKCTRCDPVRMNASSDQPSTRDTESQGLRLNQRSPLHTPRTLWSHSLHTCLPHRLYTPSMDPRPRQHSQMSRSHSQMTQSPHTDPVCTPRTMSGQCRLHSD